MCALSNGTVWNYENHTLLYSYRFVQPQAIRIVVRIRRKQQGLVMSQTKIFTNVK